MAVSQDDAYAANRTAGRTRKGRFSGDWLDIWFTLFVAAAAITALAYYLGGTSEELRNGFLLTGAVAGLAGWGTGIVASPYDTGNRGSSRIWPIIVAALAGYFFAKFDGYLSGVLASQGRISSGGALLPHLAIGIAMFLVVAITTYVFRCHNLVWSEGAGRDKR